MFHFKLWKAALSVLPLLLLVPFPESHAQSQTQTARIDTGTVYRLGEVIVSANRRQEDPQSVGRNVSVITRREIESSIHQSVGDLLASLQSLHMVGNNQTSGSIQSVFLRNANSNHTVVMIDGVRISDPSTVNNSPDLSELSLAGVERIEVIRGSHSTLYGSSAIGGAINIITRKAGRTGLNGSVATGHGILSNGNYTTTNQAELNYSFDSGFYTNLGLMQEYSGGLDATVDTVSGGFNPQDDDGFEKLDLTGKVGYRSEKLDLYAAYRNEDQGSDLDQSAFQDDDNAMIDFRRDLVHYGAAYQPDNRLELQYRGAYSDLARDFVNDSSVVSASGAYDGIFTETNGEGTLWQNELTARWRSDHFSLIGGVGNKQQTMNSRTFTLSSTFNFQSETDLDSLNLKEETNYLFLHSELEGGLIDPALAPVSLGLGTRLVDHDEFGSHLTFEINPKWQLNSGTLVYGSVTTGFNAPSLFQLHAPQRGFGALTNRGNENLDPETSVSYELGWKQELGRGLRLNLSLYRTEVDDVIEFVFLWDGNVPVENLNFSHFLGDTYLNASRQETNGLELGIAGPLLKRLHIDGSVSFSQATLNLSPDDIDQNYTQGSHVQVFESGRFVTGEEELDGLTRRPSVGASLGLTYRATDRLRVSVDQQYTGSRDDLFFSSMLGPFGGLDREELEGYYLLDLGGSYRLTDNISFQLEVENLLDNRYSEIRGFSTRGRSAYLKARYQF